MRKKIFILLILGFTVFAQSFAQLGGRYVYDFLELSYSSRSSALGGRMIPVMDKDLTLAIRNPSLLNPEMHNRFNFSFSDYLTDVAYGNVAYARKFKNDFCAMASIEYINYGEFIKADEFGNKLGTFSAGEYAFHLSASKKVMDKLFIGAGLKAIYSTFETYHSSGLATDYAISYYDEEKIMTASLLVSNLGFQFKPYTAGNQEPLPLNVQLGFSKKLAHMPLRFIIVAHHLNIPDFTYIDPNNNNNNTFDNYNNQDNIETPLSEKIFRHFNFGGEFVLSENFHLRFGYNHQKRKELQIQGRPGMVGYSFGFGLRISKFYLSYANVIHHVAGTTNHFSLTINPSDFPVF
ncbi:MAG: type IX secretion system protein PorQ [Bacteroidota bacterium]|nr:type IX secretion system protein PorQ [Bacteroidota bacterium]